MSNRHFSRVLTILHDRRQIYIRIDNYLMSGAFSLLLGLLLGLRLRLWLLLILKLYRFDFLLWLFLFGVKLRQLLLLQSCDGLLLVVYLRLSSGLFLNSLCLFLNFDLLAAEASYVVSVHHGIVYTYFVSVIPGP